jgi:hypothetical protein
VWPLFGLLAEVWAETIVTPSVSTVGSYLSNIGFSSTTSGASGGDFSVSVSPQVSVRHEGRLATGTVFAGVSATRFIRNPEFSFVSTNAGFNLTLDNLVKRLDQNLSLNISDYVSYTPQQPSFLVPQSDQGPGGVDFRGIQSARANTLTNGTTASAGYAITPRISLIGGATYSIVHFGTTLATPAVGGFFNTTSYSANAGVRGTVSPSDSVSATYNYSKADYGAVSASTANANFETNGGSLGWSHTFNQWLTGSASVNYSVVSTSNKGVYGGSATATYKVLSTTFATLSYSRQVSPSYFVAAAPLISNVFVLSVTHSVSTRMTASTFATYAHNESTSSSLGGQGALFFEAYTAGGSLSYALAKYVSATSSVNFNHNTQRLQGSEAQFSFYTITLGLSANWPYKWS